MKEIIKEVSDEMGIPFNKTKDIIYSQFEHYKLSIKNNESVCRAFHLGKWKKVK